MGCAGSHSDSAEELQKAYEKNLAWGKLKLKDYEEKVKKLVNADSKGEVSIAQLTEAFKDAPSFSDLKDKASILRKSLASRYLVQEAQLENADENTQKVSVQALLLVGVLFADGDDKTKAGAFADAVNSDAELNRDDADLAAAVVLLVQLATSWTVHYALVQNDKPIYP